MGDKKNQLQGDMAPGTQHLTRTHTLTKKHTHSHTQEDIAQESGLRKRGRPRTSYLENIKVWTNKNKATDSSRIDNSA